MMDNANLDILCFGAHPDDVEIGMGGTIAKHVAMGYKVGICDLTKAELSSNGTIEERQKEAEQAARILGAESRMNLSFPDRGLSKSEDMVDNIVRLIRTYRPQVVFLPYEDDRHPDHGHATRLVEEAVFSAGIRRFQPELPSHHVKQVYYYFINGFSKPHLLIDISNYIKTKIDALLAYQSQFTNQGNHVETRLNTGFIDVIEGRERLFGKMKNVTYAEGFMVKEPILLADSVLTSG